MKYRLLAFALLLLAAGLFWWMPSGPLQIKARDPAHGHDTRTVRPATPASVAPDTALTMEAVAATSPASPPTESTTPPPPGEDAGAAPEPEAGPELAPIVGMENMRSAFHQYQSRYGGNPVGSNQEITRALNGANAKEVVFLQPGDGLRVNGQGQLIDNWGTPYFFHQLSGREMEIHSAGPDKRLWTADDLVLK